MTVASAVVSATSRSGGCGKEKYADEVCMWASMRQREVSMWAKYVGDACGQSVWVKHVSVRPSMFPDGLC